MGGKPNLGSHLSIYILFWVSVHMMCAYAFHLYHTSHSSARTLL